MHLDANLWDANLNTKTCLLFPRVQKVLEWWSPSLPSIFSSICVIQVNILAPIPACRRG